MISSSRELEMVIWFTGSYRLYGFIYEMGNWCRFNEVLEGESLGF